VKKENVIAPQWAEMRMIRWMCGVKVTHRFACNSSTERVGTDDMVIVVQQNRLRWYEHVLRKDENGINKVEGKTPRCKKTWEQLWIKTVKTDI